MRALLAFACVIGVSLATSSAEALVYEPNDVVYPPNGLQVPLNGNNGEEELNTFFASRGESIDWVNDAYSTPSAFIPACGLTATFVLNQAGNKYGLAWYNETGTAPTAADLHEIVPAGTPVGSMVAGATIKNDPSYAGGSVGFALEVPASEGGHYTNSAYDLVCSDASVCAPSAPWILALMYASTVTPDAYYLAFEDGSTSANGWANDGDFNDDVFFLTGIACAGGGQPCSTGLAGVCAAGVSQCTTGKLTCAQAVQPSAEVCDGLDNDCNGVVDDGDGLCPAGQLCDQGACVAVCGGDAGTPCKPGFECNTGGSCVEPSCLTVTCPTGQTCNAGACAGPCDGVTCPLGQTCQPGLGTCADPCDGVTCAAGDVCDKGVCIVSCSCLACPSSLACDATSGLCVDPSCATVSCAAGTACVAGVCVDACTGAVCPTGSTCMNGACTPVAPDTAILVVTPPAPSVVPGASVAFSATGGSGTGYTWTLTTNASGATIDATTGAYVAGATPSVTDVVQVTDSVGNTGTASVMVGTVPVMEAGAPDAGPQDAGLPKDAGHDAMTDAAQPHKDGGKDAGAAKDASVTEGDAGAVPGSSGGCGCGVAGGGSRGGSLPLGAGVIGIVAVGLARRRKRG